MLRIFDKYDKTWHNGYTLAEMLIVLVIVALIMMALPRATKKLFNVTTKPGDNGRLECFYDPNAATPTLIKHYATSGGVKITCEQVNPTSNDGNGLNGTNPNQCKAVFAEINGQFGCKFEPPKNAIYMVLHAVGGGGSGAWPMIKKTNDESGTYYTAPDLEYVTKSTTVSAKKAEDEKWGDWLIKLFMDNAPYTNLAKSPVFYEYVGAVPQKQGLKAMFKDFNDGKDNKEVIETIVAWQTKKLRYTNSGKAGKILSMYFPSLTGSTLLVVPGAAGTTVSTLTSSTDYTKFNGKRGGDTLVYAVRDDDPLNPILLLKARGGAAGIVYDTDTSKVMDAYISADQPSEDAKLLYDEGIGREGSTQYEILSAKPANYMSLMSEGDGTTSQLISSYAGDNVIYPGDGGWGSFNVFYTTESKLKRFYYINDYSERLVVSSPYPKEKIGGSKWSNVSPYVVRRTAYSSPNNICSPARGSMTTDPGFKTKFIGTCTKLSGSGGNYSCTVGNNLDIDDKTCVGKMSTARSNFSAVGGTKIEQQNACATFITNGSVNTSANVENYTARCNTQAAASGNPDYCKLTKLNDKSNDPSNIFRLYGGAYGCYYDNRIGHRVEGEIVDKSAYSGRIVCELSPEKVPATLNYVECPYFAPSSSTKYPGVYECPNGTSSNNKTCKPTNGGNGAVVLLW